MEQAQLINVVDPDTGEVGSIPAHQFQDAQSQGFQQASPEQVHSFINQQKYGTTEQQVKTGLEGAGEALTFGLSTGAERALGVDPEDIQGRREENPIAHGVGQVAGLAGSTFIPVAGAANVLEKAGVAGAKALFPSTEAVFTSAKALRAAKAAGEGIEAAKEAYSVAKTAAPFLARIGSQAADQAIQFGLIQAGDEVSKMFSGAPGYDNPGEAAQSALTNIGLSSVLGGVTGGTFATVSPLWSATVGQKTENFLNSLRNRANGETIPLAKDLEAALGGVEMPPEVRAGLSENPMAKETYQALIESGTEPGLALRETRDKFQGQVGEQLSSFFKTDENLSAHEAGEKAKESILSKTEELNNQVRAKYDAVNPDNSSIIIPDNERLKFYDKLTEQGQNFGAKGGPGESVFRNYAERVLAQDTIAEQDKLITEINNELSMARRSGDFEKARALGDIKESIRDFQDVQIGKSTAKTIGEKGIDSEALADQLINERKEARKSYADFMDTLREVFGVAKLGKAKSFSQFQEVLENTPSAKLADKLFDKKNIEGMNLLKEKYPDVFESIVNQKKHEMLESSMKEGALSHSKLLGKFDALPKEIQDLMFTKDQQKSIQSLGKVMRESSVRMNPSGTARTKDTLWKHMPAGVLGIVSALTGHSLVGGILAGEAAQFATREAPDAIKLSLLKFLGSSGPVDAEAWKTATTFIDHAYKAEKLISRSTKNVFVPAAEVLPSTQFPKAADREKLDKKLKELQTDQEPLTGVGGKTSHYLPTQGAALAMTAARAVNYLNGLRPDLEKKSPLDTKPVETTIQKSEFNRALDIAEQPLIVLDDVKNGSIVPKDIVHLANLYPELYNGLKQKLTASLIEHTNEEEPVPYKTRLGLSVFLAQPMDSTMTPQAIMAMNPPPQMAQAPQQGPAPRHSSMKELGKISNNYMTASQSREAHRNKA